MARAVARLHAAGVHQPDLFFKHVLTDAAGKITILDWQQARLAKVTTAKQRARSLAALCATTPDDIGRTERLRFLKTYLTAFGQRDWKPFARQILALAADLRKRPGIRRQLGQAEVAQPLVRIHGETVCAIPAVADDLRSEAVIRQLHDATRSTPPAMLPAGTHWTARAYSRILASVRGRRWRSPELKLARLVMHLERYGIPAPRIVAYGQTPISAFVAYGQSPAGDAMPLPELVRKLHASGVVLRELPASATPFAVADGMAVIRDPACFQLAKRPTAKQRARAAG